MSITDELYREVILDHYKSPRNRGQLEQPDAAAQGNNPLCGDEIEVSLSLSGDTVTDITFQGTGCSISQASASMLTEAIKGHSLQDVHAVVAAFKNMMMGDGTVDEDLLGDLEALQGVKKFPVRVKCATLAWNTLQEALDMYKNRRTP
ncbi:MAG TPA: SUF system NifU family Fe-S cluster assembly protein [Chloroflexota bacterium]|nr:SUF system NifU family Fe-S cluster assembly protein [Chloroflexota bacterium]